MYLVSFYVSFEHIHTDAYELHDTVKFNDLHVGFEKRQLTAPTSINNINIKSEFSGKVENKESNSSGWKYFLQEKQGCETFCIICRTKQ